MTSLLNFGEIMKLIKTLHFYPLLHIKLCTKIFNFGNLFDHLFSCNGYVIELKCIIHSCDTYSTFEFILDSSCYLFCFSDRGGNDWITTEFAGASFKELQYFVPTNNKSPLRQDGHLLLVFFINFTIFKRKNSKP